MNSATPTARPLGGPLGLGLLAALATSIVWAVLSAVIGLHLGLLVVAAIGGWLIGSALKPAGPRARWVTGAIAVDAWILGAVLDFVLSQALLPDAATSLSSRLTLTGFADYTLGTFDIVQAAAIAILVVVAWRSAR
jgi:thiol:disulfide interchange protein